MSRTTIVKSVHIAGVAAIVLAACGSGSSGSGSSGAAAATGDLNIGISLSLTGDFSNTGKAGQLGYQLWADQLNGKGGLLGRHVNLHIADDASSPTQVVTNYENFITRDKVDLVFGPYSSLLTLAAAKVANRYHYAFIEGAGNGPSVFDAHLPNLICAAPATAVNGAMVWSRYILSLPADQRPKTAAYPSLNDPFSQPAAAALQKAFEAAGIQTVYSDSYPAETTDLTPVIANVASKNPDMVVSGSQDTDGWAQVKAMVQLKFNPKFLFMTNGPENPLDFPKNVGANNTPGVFTSDVWTPEATLPGNQAFVQAYIQKYGGAAGDIDSTSAETYAVGQLLEQEALKTGKLDNQTIIDTLHQGSWDTVVGTVSIDQNGAPKGTQFLEEWLNGKLTIVYPADIAATAPVVPKPAWPAS
jgi:branched-chain amino acid transport system substrate-binding protein